MMVLHNFFRSGTSHRLRIALNLKGLAYDYVSIDLPTEQHLSQAFKILNPQGLVPALVVESGCVMTQTPAIIEWLEEMHPEPPLLPVDPECRARVRALAAIVGCDVHPINNRRVLEYLRREFSSDEAAVRKWCANWIAAGFDTVEALLAADKRRGSFCFGEAPTMADVYLVPQVESARRFGLDVSQWKYVQGVDETCGQLAAFRQAAPAAQSDAR